MKILLSSTTTLAIILLLIIPTTFGQVQTMSTRTGAKEEEHITTGIFHTPELLSSFESPNIIRDDKNVLVNNFEALKTASYSGDSITIRLTADVEVTDILDFYSTKLGIREVALDLNGYTLFFTGRGCLYIGGIDYHYKEGFEIIFTLTNSQEGGAVIFQTKDSITNGLNVLHGTMVLDGNVMITTEKADLIESNLNTLVVERDASLIINSGTINGVGAYGSAVLLKGGHMVMNGGSIHGNGEGIHVVTNRNGVFHLNGGIIQGIGDRIWGIESQRGEFYLNGGEVSVSGDRCKSFYYTDMELPVLHSEDLALAFDKNYSTFVMSNGVVSAIGRNAVAVDIRNNCLVAGGSISASGNNSVGIMYDYILGEPLSINLIGGRITGESHALFDYRGLDAWYKNIAGETVMVDESVTELTPGYKDVINGSWYAYDFYQLVYDGIFTGYPGGEFRPKGNITRAEFITLLSRYAKEDLSEYEKTNPHFSDVDMSKWYAVPVAWGADCGIIKGHANGLFDPHGFITREQLITMMYRYTEYKCLQFDMDKKKNLQDFSDAEKVSDWAVDAVQWAVNTGILQGRENNRIAPQECATRAETAVFIMRVQRLFENITIT